MKVSEMTPVQLLELYEIAKGGDKLHRDLFLAASFASAAYNSHIGCDGGATIAMLHAFLTALVDPLHEELDHLRENPEYAVEARRARDVSA